VTTGRRATSTGSLAPAPADILSRLASAGAGLFVGALTPALWVALALLLVVPTACFLLLAFSPATFSQGEAWLSLESFASALQGRTFRGLINSLGIGIAAAIWSLLIAAALAWLVHRTTLRGRAVWGTLIWALLLTPSYLAALGWEALLARNGLLAALGFNFGPLRQAFFGPAGIVWLLTVKGTPFAFLALSAGLLGLGREYEDAARVHGASSGKSLALAFAILQPAVWSALAIVFAESISDFGIASTVAAGANFPVATYALYRSVSSFPIRFPVASAISWFLLAGAGIAIIVQNFALRGRTFATISGRTRPTPRIELSATQQLVATACVACFFLLALGVPILGAISASLLKDSARSISLHAFTLANYRRALASPELLGPFLYSARVATVVATLTLFLAIFVGRVLAARSRGPAAKILDLLILGAVALPGIVLAAGYIFAYNLPVFSQIGINLYGTVILLAMAYLASSLPTTSRLLVGPQAQLQRSLSDAARVHGAGAPRALTTTVLPLLAPALIWAWLLSFVHVLLELPISQLLYPPGHPPFAVGVTHKLETYDFSGGSAITVVASVSILLIVATVLAGFRLLSPRGWRQLRPR
jgi:iron(III) transport system permease protein